MKKHEPTTSILVIAPTQKTAEWMLSDYDLDNIDVLICYSNATGKQWINAGVEADTPFDVVLQYH